MNRVLGLRRFTPKRKRKMSITDEYYDNFPGKTLNDVRNQINATYDLRGTVKVDVGDKDEWIASMFRLRSLVEEDPSLNVRWWAENRGNADTAEIMFTSGSWCACVNYSSRVEYFVSGKSYGDAEAAYKFVCDWLEDCPERKTQDEGVVYIDCWKASQRGYGSHSIEVECPKFEEIEDNYSAEVKAELVRLISLKKPYERGKLVFWMGEPGTGKTWAIRSLLREWGEKSSFHVISDVERFVNDIEYFMQVLSEGSRSEMNVIILEDAPQAVLNDARRDGNTYAMSRMLNLTDGLIGHSRKVLFLMTTNDSITDIDDAFLRPGRCLQRLEFTGLTRHEAEHWLQENGVDPAKLSEFDDDTIRLCDLYAIRDEKHPLLAKHENDPIVGFSANES